MPAPKYPIGQKVLVWRSRKPTTCRVVDIYRPESSENEIVYLVREQYPSEEQPYSELTSESRIVKEEGRWITTGNQLYDMEGKYSPIHFSTTGDNSPDLCLRVAYLLNTYGLEDQPKLHKDDLADAREREVQV